MIDALLSKTPDDAFTEAETEAIVEHFNKIFHYEPGKGLNDFNGHFWVEMEDGSVLDDYDWNKEVKQFKKCFGIRRTDAVLEHDKCEAELTQKVVMSLLNKYLTQSGMTVEEAYRFFGIYWSPKRLCCMFNAVRNQALHGGKVVFGCVFMRSDDGKKKHYISGGANFTTLHDFKKPHNPYLSLL